MLDGRRRTPNNNSRAEEEEEEEEEAFSLIEARSREGDAMGRKMSEYGFVYDASSVDTLG